MTAGFSLRGLLIALGIVALSLAAALFGLFSVFAQISDLNAKIANVREAQLNIDDVLRLQIEQETAVRGFAATRDPSFTEAYRNAAREFPLRVGDVASRLSLDGEDRRAAAALSEASHINERWRASVARRVFGTPTKVAAQYRNVHDFDRFRAAVDVVGAILIADYHGLVRRRVGEVHMASIVAYGAIAVVALQILVYAVLVARLRGELVRERRVVSLLQRAFASEIVNDGQLDVAVTYVSATRGAKVGGDVYDVFPLSPQRTLVVIADVSGKGVEAAVDSTFVKFSLRALAAEYSDIATIANKFNALYCRAQKAPEAFVVVFAGILDRATASLAYVNCGHEAAYIRRRTSIEQLAPTGPIVGLFEQTIYNSAITRVHIDDLLFLATDGLTEARDPSGNFLTGAGVEAWLRDTGDAGPAQVVDTLARRLRRFTRARNNDDLAILAVRPS